MVTPDAIVGAALLVALGLIVASYGSAVGAGGGFLLVPVLLLLDPQESARTITALSLTAVALNGLSASLAYAGQGRIDYLSGVHLAASAIPGAILGSWLTRFVPRELFDFGFGLLLILLTVFLLFPSQVQHAVADLRNGWVRRELTDASGLTYVYAFNQRFMWLIGFAEGLISSLAGIGGGPLIVPAIVRILHFPVHVATATSTFVVLLAALTATGTHLLVGDFDFGLERIALIGLGVIVGGQIGARLSQRLPRGVILHLLAVGIAIIGIRLVASGVSSLLAQAA